MQTSKQRLLAALAHREPEKLPFDLGSTKMTGISYTAYTRYLDFACLNSLDEYPQMQDILQQLARPSEAFLRYLECDVRGIFPASVHPMMTEVRGAYTCVRDEWGIGWKMPVNGGLYYDLSESPLAQADELNLDLLESFPFPDPNHEGRFETLHKQIEGKGNFGLTMHGITSGVLEMAMRLRGFENFLADMLITPDMARALLERITDIKIEFWERALQMTKGSIDVIIEPDDLGTQDSLLVSPEVYRKLVKPCHLRLFTAIKRIAPSIKIFLHSCGAVYPLIHDFIESGVDVLNPVQVSAAGMDLTILKHEFGRDLTFWGGGIDTQWLLPYGKPSQIKDEVKRAIDILAPGGGFVFNTVHNIQSDVPPENLDALFNALSLYR